MINLERVRGTSASTAISIRVELNQFSFPTPSYVSHFSSRVLFLGLRYLLLDLSVDIYFFNSLQKICSAIFYLSVKNNSKFSVLGNYAETVQYLDNFKHMCAHTYVCMHDNTGFLRDIPGLG